MIAKRDKKNYLREIKTLNTIKQKDLCFLVSEMLQGSQEAREQIVLSQLTVVVEIAREYSGRGLEPEELVAEGNCGLLQAVNTYQVSLGDFEVYAKECIRGAMNTALELLAEQLKERRAVEDKINSIIKAIQSLTKKTDRIPTDEELAKFLKIDVDELQYLMKLTGFLEGNGKNRKEE